MCNMTMTEHNKEEKGKGAEPGSGSGSETQTETKMPSTPTPAPTNPAIIHTVNLIELATHCIHSTLLASKPIQYLTKYKDLTVQQPKKKKGDPSGSCSDSDSATSVTNSTTNTKREEDVNNKDDDTSISLPSSSSSSSLVDGKILTQTQTEIDSQTQAAIHDILQLQSPRIQKRIKTDGTIITDADGLAQRIIYQEIHHLNPHVHVIGEESEAEMQHFLNQMNNGEKELESHLDHLADLDLDLEGTGTDTNTNMDARKITTSSGNENESGSEDQSMRHGCTTAHLCQQNETLLSRIREEMSQYKYKHNLQSHLHDQDDSSSSPDTDTMDMDIDMDIDTRRVSVFVDPLDGTSSYAKGNYEAVTILVAIIVDNVPVFGVICKPFAIGTMVHQYLQTNCTVLYGGTLIGGAYVLGGEEMKRSQIWNNNNNRRRKIGKNERSYSTSTTSSLAIGKEEVETETIAGRNEQQQETVLTCTTLPKSIPSADDYEDSSSSSATTSPTASSTSSSSSTHTETQSIEMNLPYTRIRSDPGRNSTDTDNHNHDLQHNIQRRAIISKSRAGGVVKKCIDSLSSKDLLHPTPMFVTGAGYKTMKLVLGEENEALWFFPRPGTSLWDVAAADALLRVMGGRITDKYGKDLDYGRCVHVAKVKGSHPRLEAENEDGIIACCDLELHAKCLQLYKDEDWDLGCD